MMKLQLPNERIESIEWAQLPYRRPRPAGCNARLGVHGPGGEVPIARVRIGGVTGFGWCTASREQARRWVGAPASALLGGGGLLRRELRGLEFPLLDWMGAASGEPVYRMVAASPAEKGGRWSVPVYDTTIYFDELDEADDAKAVEKIVAEVEYGLAQGHRHFKVKVGRGGLWMDVESGMRRDAALILAIRERIGPEGKLMADANNGWNVNLTKRFLTDTMAAKLYWLEEPFHEDGELYGRLRAWMNERGCRTMIADGEGYAAPVLEDWAKKGLIDVVQYDLRGYGFYNWVELARALAPWGILCAPHNYGGYYGNFAQVHFAAAAENFAFAEWDSAKAEGIDDSGYTIRDGRVEAPEAPGFGLRLDDEAFSRRVQWRETL